MNNKETQVILETQIGNIKALLGAEVSSSIVCRSDGKCEYKLTFTYDKPNEALDSSSLY
jgi:hypothetical protein